MKKVSFCEYRAQTQPFACFEDIPFNKEQYPRYAFGNGASPTDFDHLISTEDAGTLLGVSQRRVNQLIADGYIERVKAGRVSASSAPRRICASGRQGCGAVPDADTRAALVAMGQDIERACDALAKTQRRSIEQIYRNDFRFRDVPKPATTEKQKALLYTHKTVTQAGGGNVNRFGAD